MRYPIAEWMNDPTLCTKEKLESLLTACQIHYVECKEKNISRPSLIEDLAKTTDFATYEQNEDFEAWFSVNDEMVEYLSILTPDMVAMLVPIVESSERKSFQKVCQSHQKFLDHHPNYALLMKVFCQLHKRTLHLPVLLSLSDQKEEIEAIEVRYWRLNRRKTSLRLRS